MTQLEIHSEETAPAGSKALLAGVKERYGFVPNLLGELAEAPVALKTYLSLAELLDETSFSAVERQIILLAASAANGCRYCLAAHTPALKQAGLDDRDLEAVRAGQPLADARLEALRRLVTELVERRGWVDESHVRAFLDAGYDRAQLLEIFVGIAMKTLSNYVNHVAGTPLDTQLQPFAVEVGAEAGAGTSA